MKNTKLFFSILIGLGFAVWAFWSVDLREMWQSLRGARYIYLVPMLGLLFFGHWLRVLRWQRLLPRTVSVRRTDLFSALLIGYMANTVMPAHLGEFVRAMIVGKRGKTPTAQVFSSIVIERVLDLAAFFMIAGFGMLFFPFPDWIIRGGYFAFLLTVISTGILYFIKRKTIQLPILLEKILQMLPVNLRERILKISTNFLEGFGRLNGKRSYFWIPIESILIWLTYGAIFWLGFRMMRLEAFRLNWLSALVLLVLTTIGVIVPNSPGYVGTYHKLCQLGLGLFGVPASAGMSFAIVLHAVNFLPVMVAGFFLMLVQGWSWRQIAADRPEDTKTAEPVTRSVP